VKCKKCGCEMSLIEDDDPQHWEWWCNDCDNVQLEKPYDFGEDI
jgi:transcription initiation factor TFIIIB Brf1 subunit/transcription initiation factor TFIIB